MAKFRTKSCHHLDELTSIKLTANRGCEECMKTGDQWVHLRCCQTCGAVLCCDSSVNKHASKHASQSGHPVAASAEPGETWAWCYQDQLLKRF